MRFVTLALTVIATAFVISCTEDPRSDEPKFEQFGFWVEHQNHKTEIPKREIDMGATSRLKKDAIEVSLNDNEIPTFYYYGDITASLFSLKEIHWDDVEFDVKVAPLSQAGAYKITPKTTLTPGEYYIFSNGHFGYPFHISGSASADSQSTSVISNSSVSPSTSKSTASDEITKAMPNAEASDDGIRLRVKEGLNLAGAAKQAVSETFEKQGKFPGVGNNSDANAVYGLPTEDGIPRIMASSYVKGIAALDSGVLRITYNDNLGGDPSANGRTILLKPTMRNNQIIDWDCTGGTMPAEYRPRSCR